jgi:hypothetical protein
MRYVSGMLYATAIAAHSGALLNALVLWGLIFAGTVAFAFAVEGIVNQAVRAIAHDISGAEHRIARVRRRWF